MEIRIGIINGPRELNFETDESAAEVEKVVSTALEEGAKFIRLADNQDRIFLIPTQGLAYIELGSEHSRRVGFVA